ncbi:MAG: DUF4142 domain-containing protein [Nitrospirota bacterium]|nr:DUF4142 domain-containing protein [Nitrospirota bacterium]
MNHCRLIRLRALVLLLTLGAIGIAPAGGHGAPSAFEAGDQAIMAAFIQTNQFDVDMATLAIRKAARTDVKELAEMIVHDHADIGHQAEALQTTLGWTQAAAVSVPRRQADDKALAELQVAMPHGFDDRYLHHEEAFSLEFVQTLKTQWLPAAKQPQLKKFLSDVAKQLDEHMAHMNHVSRASRPHEPLGH